MPRDAKGNFHLSTQRMMAHDPKPKSGSGMMDDPMADSDDNATQEHEPGSIHEHMAQMHAEHGGKHMHVIEKPEGGYQSHHVGEDGKVEGPHDHENLESLKGHLGKFFDEEAHEPNWGEGGHSHNGGGTPEGY
jgi:hypothetical protein